jgi:hypothetical protein
MKQRAMWPFGLVVVLLAAVGTSRAGVQERVTVCWLGTGNWQLLEKEGNVYLVECGWQWLAARLEDKRSALAVDEHRKWHVSAPTIKSQSGKFLGSDPEGHTPSVGLVKDKGANTRWAFDIVDHIHPGDAKGEDRRMKAGPSGFRFRVKMDAGRFKNWYLAVEEPRAERQEREGEGGITRRLKLVRDVKQATVFTYIDENYYVDHK